MYFVSKVLTDAETRYTEFEEIVLAFIMATKMLHPYFQAHTIVILTTYMIRAIIYKPDALGLLLEWAVELSEFDIEYHLRLEIKAQILAYFIAQMLDVQP